MAPEEREGEFEDLFDDLDSFFEPEGEGKRGSAGPTEEPQEDATSERVAKEPRPEEARPEEEPEEEFGVLTEESAPDETLFGYDQEEGDEEEEPALTLEDLRKAPPEYQDLPGAAEPDVGEEEDLVGVARSPMAWPEEGEEPAASEPAMAEVEAAADELARQFGPSPSTIESEPSSSPTSPDDDDDLLADLHPPGPRTIKV